MDKLPGCNFDNFELWLEYYLSHDLSRLFLAQNSILQNGTTFNYHHSDDTDTYIISVSNLILPNLYMYSFIRIS